MNWTHFLLWLTALYGLYYLIVILSDTLGAGKRSATVPANELTFTEYEAPVQLAEAALPEKRVKPLMSNEVIASGGVPITDLFRLARQEAIIYTRSVSF